MNTSRGRLMQTSVTRGLSKMGRRGLSVCVNEDALSSASDVPTLVSRGGAQFIHRPKVDVPCDDHLEAGTLIDGDGGRNVDAIAQDVIDHLLTALRIQNDRRPRRFLVLGDPLES